MQHLSIVCFVLVFVIVASVLFVPSTKKEFFLQNTDNCSLKSDQGVKIIPMLPGNFLKKDNGKTRCGGCTMDSSDGKISLKCSCNDKNGKCISQPSKVDLSMGDINLEYDQDGKPKLVQKNL